MDVTAYFDRIGHSGDRAATLATLRAVVAGHNRSIPFENLDPLLGVPVADLGPAALADKLVHRRRGGYCYEHNGLLGYVLAELGYDVHRLAGRVVWMNPEWARAWGPDAGFAAPLPAQTHQMLSVGVPGEDGRFAVDVGFGGQTLTSPIRLAAGVEQETRHEPYRLSGYGDGYLLEALVRDTWRPLYVFGTRPQPRTDLEVGSWYVSTHPASPFVVGLTAALIADDARHNLRGRHLAIHHPDGTEKIRFDTAAQVLEALTDRFGIDLSLGAGIDVEARVHAVLDR